MKTRLIIALISLSFASLSLGQETATKKYFEDIYTRLSSLMLKRDAVGTEKLFVETAHPKFIYIGLKGEKQSGKEMVAVMKMQMALMTKCTKSVTTIDRFNVKGDTATLTTSMSYAMAMTDPQTKKSHTYEGKSVGIDTWKKVGNAWKLYQVKSISDEGKMDGKPMKM